MTTVPEFTVIIPTHNHARLLPYAMHSVLAQTVGSFELIVIGDGVGDETRDAVADLSRNNKQITFVDRPKSPRTGEPYRHEELLRRETPYVTYVSDDDLLLPDHLEHTREMLATHDLVHGFGLHVDATGSLILELADLGQEWFRRRELKKTSHVGLTAMGHTMAAYRRLPYGWRTTPSGKFTDHYMFQQFLSDPACRVTTLRRPTALKFPFILRQTWTDDEREQEMALWARRLSDVKERVVLLNEIMTLLHHQAILLEIWRGKRIWWLWNFLAALRRWMQR
jgi:glycosyltransferase involved in cell wall biosynthesis